MALGKNLIKKTTEKETVPNDKDNNDLDTDAEDSAKDGEESNEEESIKHEILSQYCVFKSGKEEYAIPINLVSEVVVSPDIAPIPEVPKYIIGMTNVRGNIFGILDLNRFFNSDNEGTTTTDFNYLLVLEHDEYKMGVCITEVPDTLMASDSMIEKLSASRLKSTTGQKYLKGIIKKDRRMIILFDILGMITSDQFTQTS